MKLLQTIVLIVLPLTLFSQTRISQEIQTLKDQEIHFIELDLFTADVNQSLSDIKLDSKISKARILDVNKNVLEEIHKRTLPYVRLNITDPSGVSLQIELIEHQVFSSSFECKTALFPNTPVEYKSGKHYKGIIQGQPNSVVAFSFFEYSIMAMLSSPSLGNLNLGPIENNPKNKHLLFNEIDLNKRPNYSCDTNDDVIPYKAKDLRPTINHQRSFGDCIRIHVEIDDDIVDQKGGVAPAMDYISGLFNQSFVIYNNEFIEMEISSVMAWDTPSPFNAITSAGMLQAFQDSTDHFNAYLSHLVSYKSSGGIAAGTDGLCNAEPDNSKCFSHIDSTYLDLPNYSWSVMLITHEMGHLLGSKHTHACVWNTNNTAIDGCAGSVEGDCPLPPNPSEGGTIMSYCHLTSVGINLSLGFGLQPGIVIRNSLYAAQCTAPCGPPTCMDNIMNGNETGVDCGGPDCPPCATCTDGLMNGNETGVDCGGPDCPPCPCLENEVTLTINFDAYPEETSWDIMDAGGHVIAAGGPYPDMPDNGQLVEDICLPMGCFTFTIYDLYNDGICCGFGNGNYELIDSLGNLLVSGSVFTSSASTAFCPNPDCFKMVTEGEDSVTGSLRNVIDNICPGGIIHFNPQFSNQYIFIEDGEIIIDKDLTIKGLGMNNMYLSALFTTRIFKIEAGVNVTLQEFNLENAAATSLGGAILNEGTLVLENILFKDNTSGGLPRSISNVNGGNVIIRDEVKMKE